MSFYSQPDKYRCGPFSLKHALVMLGIFQHEDQISLAAESTWWNGTDETGLVKAARRYKCKLIHFQSSNPDDARRLLNNYLKKRLPCILSVNNWEHWVTVVSYTKGKYVLIDSEMDKVISIKSSNQLLRYWKYKDYYDNVVSYDGYVLQPKFKVYTRAKFTPSIANYLMYKKNEELSKKWDKYFDDLISICKPRTKLTINMITFSEFLRRNEKNLVKKIADWHGMPAYNELKKILQNMRFVADVYDLIIPIDDEKKCLIDISSLLMLYSCGKYGMDPIY